MARQVAALGVTCEEISVGATPTARHSATLAGITELRPGNYAYYDRMQVALGAATWDDCALTVLARVVSRPAADRVILDSGSKTLTNDVVRGPATLPATGSFSTRSTAPPRIGRLVIERLSEEHAKVTVTGECALAPGDLVRVIPNHSAPCRTWWTAPGRSTASRCSASSRLPRAGAIACQGRTGP